MKDYKRLTFKRLVDPYDDDCEETEILANKGANFLHCHKTFFLKL